MSEPVFLPMDETAHHEAGHTVVAFVLGATRFESVEIFERANGRSIPRFPQFDGTADEGARIVVMIGLAGGIAQARYLELRHGMPREAAYDHSLKYCSADMERILDALMVMGSDASALGDETRNLVVNYWEHIEKVAHELLKTNRLSNEEVLSLLAPIRDKLGSRSSQSGLIATATT